MKAAYFQGNAPVLGGAVFSYTAATVYYLPGMTGWNTAVDSRPTAPWQPQIQTSDGSFGVEANRFGFMIAWASDRIAVVEASTDLTEPIWSAVGTNTPSGGSSYFSDPHWANYPRRFYRIRSP